MSSDLPDYAVLARKHWTESNAKYTDARARESWARPDIKWGVFNNLEAEVRILPDLHGREVIELGCGTAYFGAWLKKHGAKRVVGVDITPAQLDTARRMNAEFDLGLEFIEANAEEVPLPGASFDIAFSEYGASIWCDPYRWIPEAARLLRPSGELIFMRETDLQMVCSPDDEKISECLMRPLRGMKRLDWVSDPVSTEFHLNHSDLFALLKRTGFDVVDFRQLYAPDDAVDHPFYDYVPAAWARKWPSEEIWRARKS
jgi:SAM-dependent methyltransferase